jgi:lipoyl(octanoyl) transferase
MESQLTLKVANLGAVDYATALALQEAMVAARHSGEIGDTLLLLEHPHVFTLGRGADERYLLAGRPETVPVLRVSRGGQVTYHGPGQLVGYPILKLEGRNRDVHGYLRRLEESMIRALAEYGVAAERREGLTGVWVKARKIGFIGVGIRRWVTCHGFALNVHPNLDFFRGIVPCGIEGCETTSLAALGKRAVTVDGFAATMRSSFQRTFGYPTATDVDARCLLRMIDRERAVGEARNQKVV